MECHEAQEQILESFERVAPASTRASLEAHLADCVVCARFARVQETLDLRLRETLVPPVVSPAFRAAVRGRLHGQVAPPPDALFETVHFASFGVATMALSAYLPFGPWIVIGAGATAALASYVVLSVIWGVFEAPTLEGYA